MRSGRTGRSVCAAGTAAVVAAALLSGCTGSDDESPQHRAARTFLDAVGRRDADAAGTATDAETTATRAVSATLRGLGRVARAKFEVTRVRTSGDRTVAEYDATWTLTSRAPKATWKYSGSLPLMKSRGKWRVAWQAADLHPKLAAGQHLATVTSAPTRGTLQDAAGKALFAPTPVVTIGLQKSRVTNLRDLARKLAAVPELDSTAREIESAVTKAKPSEFIPVITLRRPAYDRIRDRIHDLPGTVFQTATKVLAPDAQFGRQLLGRVAPPTAEMIARSHGRLSADVDTGVGGLQQALDEDLAGRPGVTVVAVTDDGSAPPERLATITPAVAGTPVRLTIDRATQAAADDTLRSVRQQASVVAVQRSTGRVLADGNSAEATYDFGLQGAFPPGSTFKIATWTAAFAARPTLTPGTRVACPATVTVDGRRFENENKFSHPPIPVSSAFGYSCNTSAIRAALALPTDALARAARTLGLGGSWTLPVTAFSGSLPAPRTQTERAADAIGQGRVLASPLLMALMVGAASSGSVFAPQLLRSAAPKRAGTVPSGIVTKLRPLLQATVQLPGGTGHTLDGLGGVEGKTGTAEYGTATPPRSHSWFAGVRGDVAFAVFVYDGASSGTSAVTLAKRFLQKLS